MNSIFYDLETTDKNPIGQILNYCFILVDDNFEPIDELSGLISISRLQLPSPGAILANRVDVIEHQKIAVDDECTALRSIASFLGTCINRSRGAVPLIGYNSSRFDLNYLRTSFIRNGINPYFGGKLPSKDLLHGVQKAYLTSVPFRRALLERLKGEKKLSLSLENSSRALGLLDGKQAHESREDVLITIRLAVWLLKNASIDVRSFEAYEGVKVHATARSGAVYTLDEPEYDLAMDTPAKRSAVTLLDADHRSALWILLDRYAEKPDATSIIWRSQAKHSFFLGGSAVHDPHYSETARRAVAAFRTTNLKNYFERSTCDIEQDIYRLDFDALGALCRALETGDRSLLGESPHPDARILWVRHKLCDGGFSIDDSRCRDLLRSYALHRYGGQLQLVRSKPKEAGEGNHETFRQLMSELKQARESAKAVGQADDCRLLDSLESFYRASDIVRVAGAELSPEWAKDAKSATPSKCAPLPG